MCLLNQLCQLFYSGMKRNLLEGGINHIFPQHQGKMRGTNFILIGLIKADYVVVIELSNVCCFQIAEMLLFAKQAVGCFFI